MKLEITLLLSMEEQNNAHAFIHKTLKSSSAPLPQITNKFISNTTTLCRYRLSKGNNTSIMTVK